MKKFVFYMLLGFSFFALASCGDDDKEDLGEAWKITNEEAWIKIVKDPAYKEIKSEGKNGSVYYKVLQEGEPVTDPEKQIYFTSKVKVYYKGSTIDGTVFDQRLEENEDDPLYLAINPLNAEQTVGGAGAVIEGWSVALQHMKIGDKWEIYIPNKLGYGDRDYGSIKAHSVLIFEIEVIDVVNN